MKYNTRVVLAYFKECGLPDCVPEFQFHPERKWRFDFSWPENRVEYRGEVDLPRPVCLEVEGGLWVGGGHSRGSGRVKDIEKYSEAAAMGWRILYCQPKDLCTQATVNLIKRALAI